VDNLYTFMCLDTFFKKMFGDTFFYRNMRIIQFFFVCLLHGHFFCGDQGFEPQTLLILCIVSAN